MKALLVLLTLSLSSLYAQEVKDPWLKKPMPGLKMTAAYMTIVNNTAEELFLEKVTGPDAKFYEIHTHSKVNGVMKMRKIEGISIAPGKEHTLRPMSDHIMLIQMPKAPFNKTESQLTLHFKGGKTLKVKLPVIKK